MERLPDNNDVEVIIVNDGSPDNSLALIQSFLAKQSESVRAKITLINQQNKGLSGARNTGIDAATGQYIAFLDSDDILQGNYFNDILAIINKFHPDIIQHHVEKVDIDGTHFPFLDVIMPEGYYQLNDAIWQKVCDQSIWFACIRVIKRQFFDSLRFPEGRNYEDIYTTPYIFLNAKTIYFSEKVYLGYRVNPSSITANPSVKNIDDLGDAVTKLIDYLDISPQLSATFVSLAHYHTALSYENESYQTARRRWQLLKRRLNNTGFELHRVHNKEDQLFYDHGVEFIYYREFIED